MKRRTFLGSTAAVAAMGAAPAASAATGKAPKVLFKLGCQSAPSNDTHFGYFARYGVQNVCGYPEIADGRLYATVEELKKLTDLGAKHGISIDCLAPPFL